MSLAGAPAWLIGGTSEGGTAGRKRQMLHAQCRTEVRRLSLAERIESSRGARRSPRAPPPGARPRGGRLGNGRHDGRVDEPGAAITETTTSARVDSLGPRAPERDARSRWPPCTRGCGDLAERTQAGSTARVTARHGSQASSGTHKSRGRGRKGAQRGFPGPDRGDDGNASESPLGRGAPTRRRSPLPPASPPTRPPRSSPSPRHLHRRQRLVRRPPARSRRVRGDAELAPAGAQVMQTRAVELGWVNGVRHRSPQVVRGRPRHADQGGPLVEQRTRFEGGPHRNTARSRGRGPGQRGCRVGLPQLADAGITSTGSSEICHGAAPTESPYAGRAGEGQADPRPRRRELGFRERRPILLSRDLDRRRRKSERCPVTPPDVRDPRHGRR